MAYVREKKTDKYEVGTVVIADGESLSDAFPVGGKRLVFIEVPAITSATLSFKVQIMDDEDFQDFYDETGAEITVGSAFTGARTFLIPQLAGVRAVKVRSGTTGSPVTQSGGDTLRLSAVD